LGLALTSNDARAAEAETHLNRSCAADRVGTSFHSAHDSYKAGIGTLTDAVSAQTGLASARATVVRAHAQTLINGAALAFAAGLLTSSSDFASAKSR
jgi:outer membrane protein TolC